MKKILQTISKYFVYLCTGCVPKDSKMIFLRSFFPYRDNMQALLECILSGENTQQYKIVCSGFGFENYTDNNIQRVPLHNIKSFYYYCRAKYVFTDNGAFLNTPAIKNQIKVNVFHGMPLKKIGNYCLDGVEIPPKKAFTYSLATSFFFVPIIAEAFGNSEDEIIIAGEPRTDYFFNKNFELKMKFGIKKQNDEKLLVWMPTYRQSKYTNLLEGEKYEWGIPFLNLDTIQILNSFLEENKMKLIIKMHNLQKLSITSSYSKIVIMYSDDFTQAQIPQYALLKEADALITDYSSVFIDYLLLKRPIFFAYDDLGIYKESRGFIFDNIEELFPGPISKNFWELIKNLTLYASGKDYYSEIRKEYNEKFNAYQDGKSAYRILHAVGIL